MKKHVIILVCMLTLSVVSACLAVYILIRLYLKSSEITQWSVLALISMILTAVSQGMLAYSQRCRQRQAQTVTHTVVRNQPDKSEPADKGVPGSAFRQ